jgi:hypothetical protein
MSDFRQRRLWILYLTICVAAGVYLGVGGIVMAEPAPKKDPAPVDIVGSWQQVVAVVGKEVRPPKKDGTEIKLLHITPTHFTRIVYNPKTSQLMGVVGGTCPLAAGKHVETIAYADEASRKQAEGQAPLEFQYKIEGDLLILTLPAGATPYSETWKRVK